MSQPKLRVGMIGLWNFGAYRRDRMRDTGLFQIVAGVDRNDEFLRKAAEQDGLKPCKTVEEMLAHDIEAVVVSTGADSHAALSVQAMRAGKHVFVEKPLCCSVEEVKLLRQVSEETGSIVGVGHSDNQTNPLSMLAHKLIKEGTLGTVACYEENSSHSGGLEIKPGEWRGLADRNPGGMLFQCGVHALHSISDIFGPVTAVNAMMRYDANPNTQTADVANVLLRHASGIVGTLNCYHITAYFHKFRIFGTKASLYLDNHEKRAFLQERKRNEVEHVVEIALPAVPANTLTSNVENWYHAVRSNNPKLARPSLEDGINAVMPVFAAEASAKQGRTIEIEELLPGAVAV